MGVSAKNQATTNFKNTVSCFKRFIGRRFKDPQVQNEINHYPKPFKVTEGPGGETLIQVIRVQNLETDNIINSAFLLDNPMFWRGSC